MRNTGTAYLLLAMQAFGLSGLHRFYLGKPVSGLLWFCTYGLLGIGTIYDLLTMRQQVDEVNRRFLPPGTFVLGALPPASQRFAAVEPPPLQLRVLKVARDRGGRLTVIQAAAELGVRTEEVEEQLDALCREGHATVEVSEDGVLYYDFPELRFS